ncbi:MAG: spore coat associated protein CotJA [Clostridia bacterium]|nr:spore coat associated protein CotJA [Clostridia bacterium]
MRKALNNSPAPTPQRNERTTWGLEGYPLASVYAPIQEWRNLYDNETGFNRGTIFKELDLPFLCGERKGGSCNGR